MLVQNKKNIHYLPKDLLHFNVFEPTIPTEGQVLDPDTVRRLDNLCEEVIGDAPCFEVHYKGIISTDNALLLCGYAEQPLADMRARFMERIAQYPTDFGLPEGITPTSYQLEKNSGTTAPVTVVRLQGPLQNPDKYVSRVERAMKLDLGHVGITQLSFTKHGWHNNPEQREVVRTYHLK
jgi:hypothetical protein